MVDRYWRCAACGYEGNLHYLTNCTSCQRQRPPPEPEPAAFRARAGDPDTSHAAARTVPVTARQQQVLDIIRTKPDSDWCGEDIELAADFTGSWKRISELLRAGRIYDTGRLKVASTGNKQHTFRLIGR